MAQTTIFTLAVLEGDADRARALLPEIPHIDIRSAFAEVMRRRRGNAAVVKLLLASPAITAEDIHHALGLAVRGPSMEILSVFLEDPRVGEINIAGNTYQWADHPEESKELVRVHNVMLRTWTELRAAWVWATVKKPR